MENQTSEAVAEYRATRSQHQQVINFDEQYQWMDSPYDVRQHQMAPNEKACVTSY